MAVTTAKSALSARTFVDDTKRYARRRQFIRLFSPVRLIQLVFDFFYILLQRIIVFVFKPASTLSNSESHLMLKDT